MSLAVDSGVTADNTMDEKIDYETVKGQLEMLLLKTTLRGIMIGAEWQKHNTEELKTAKDLAKSIGVRVKVRRKNPIQSEVHSLHPKN